MADVEGRREAKAEDKDSVEVEQVLLLDLVHLGVEEDLTHLADLQRDDASQDEVVQRLDGGHDELDDRHVAERADDVPDDHRERDEEHEGQGQSSEVDQNLWMRNEIFIFLGGGDCIAQR